MAFIWNSVKNAQNESERVQGGLHIRELDNCRKDFFFFFEGVKALWCRKPALKVKINVLLLQIYLNV